MNKAAILLDTLLTGSEVSWIILDFSKSYINLK